MSRRNEMVMVGDLLLCGALLVEEGGKRRAAAGNVSGVLGC